MISAMAVLAGALMWTFLLVMLLAFCRAAHHEDVRRGYVEDDDSSWRQPSPTLVIPAPRHFPGDVPRRGRPWVSS